MLTPLDTLHINLEEYEGCEEPVRELAVFCAQLLQALRFLLSLD